MSRLDELRHIADLVGIATRHVDALGVVHEPGEEVLSRLIAAFGLPSDPKEAADALAEEDRAAPFGLAPVHILSHEAPAPALPLRLPAAGPGVEGPCRVDRPGRWAPPRSASTRCMRCLPPSRAISARIRRRAGPGSPISTST